MSRDDSHTQATKESVYQYAEARVKREDEDADAYRAVGDALSDSTSFSIISSENLTLHSTVLTKVHEEINAPFIHCGPFRNTEERLDVAINWLATGSAIALTPAALVFFGVSLDDDNL